MTALIFIFTLSICLTQLTGWAMELDLLWTGPTGIFALVVLLLLSLVVQQQYFSRRSE